MEIHLWDSLGEVVKEELEGALELLESGADPHVVASMLILVLGEHMQERAN